MSTISAFRTVADVYSADNAS